MKKKRALILAVVLLFILSVIILNHRFKIVPQNPKINNQTPYVTINAVNIMVEIADTPEKRALGLSNRERLSGNQGMLFVFEEKDIIPIFWMKDMQFAIDIIWINDGKIVQVDKNIPAPSPRTPDSQLVLYKPEEPIDYVLEVASGFSEKNKVAVGSEISLPSGY